MDKETKFDPATVARVAAGGASERVSSADSAAWFSPMQPLHSVAQEKAHGRQFDYPTGYNTRIKPKDDAAVTYAELRALADNLDVLRLVIETRKDQVEACGWDVVAKKGRSATDAEISAAREIFDNPTMDHTWTSWLRCILEEVFVIDAVAILPQYTRGGGIYALDLIDGSTIKRVIDAGGRTPQPPDPAYQQILKGVPATNYQSDELLFMMRNPRVSKIYGFSPVEQIVMTINVALRRQITQLQYFTEGNIPEALAGVPKEWNPDQVAQFQMYFDSIMSGNTATRSRLKFLPLDVNNIKETKNQAIKDVFDEWLARVVCFAFSIPPTPFVSQMNRATSESAQEAATNEGLKPTLIFVKRIADAIISKHLKLSNIEFSWLESKAVGALEQANINKIYIETGVKTVDEVRAELGLEASPQKPEVTLTTVAVEDAAPVAKMIEIMLAQNQKNADNLFEMQKSSAEAAVAQNAGMAKAAGDAIAAVSARSDDLVKAACREIPTPIIHVTTGETIVNATIQAPAIEQKRTVTATRMPDGTMVANIT